jgi:hypothetical protein
MDSWSGIARMNNKETKKQATRAFAPLRLLSWLGARRSPPCKAKGLTL